eukprot:980607-Ditylum_brightwellii.AAC.1
MTEAEGAVHDEERIIVVNTNKIMPSSDAVLGSGDVCKPMLSRDDSLTNTTMTATTMTSMEESQYDDDDEEEDAHEEDENNHEEAHGED